MTTDGALNVTAWKSRRLDLWLMEIRHGSHGPRLTFRMDQGREISDQLIDLIEAVESKNGAIN